MSATLLGLATFVYLAAFVLSLAAILGDSPQKQSYARPATLIAFIVQSAGMGLRWWESYQLGIGHAPLVSFYESLVFFAWAVIALSIAALRVKDSLMLPCVLILAVVLLGYASFTPQMESGIKPLIPALKSNWLTIHVMTCFLGYSAFVLASIAGLFALKKKSANQEGHALQDLFSRNLAIGFILFTVGIMTGSVWAYQTWGRYWGWDPKETWALITWLIYAAVIHQRVKDGVLSKRTIILAVIGLISVVFTYIGVNYLPGLHSYL